MTTIRHLLTMSTGHATETLAEIEPTDAESGEGSWVRQILALHVPGVPGSRFAYNTGATYLAGVIVQRRTGLRLIDYLGDRVLGPLGIQDASWEQDPDGLDVGGYGMRVRTEDLAKLGLLCLRRGEWDGVQLVPAEWIDAATSHQIDNTDESPEWRQGYGFQFWRSRFGAYRADGAFGQFSIVWPEHDIVLAITSGVQDLQSVQDAVWDGLLPALDQAVAREAGVSGPGASDAAPDGPSARAAGPHRASDVVAPDDGVVWDLHLPLPVGEHRAPDASIAGRTYRMAPNSDGLEALELIWDQAGMALRAEVSGREYRFSVGQGGWVRQRVDLADGARDLACAAAWPSSDTLVVQMIAVASPFAWTLTLRFADDDVTVFLDQNVSFGETHLLDAKGTAA